MKLLGQTSRFQLLSGAEQHCSFNYTLEFANIPRPVVTQQSLHSGRREISNLLSILKVEALEKMPGNQRHVVETLAQRRHFDLDRADAKVQVLAQNAAFKIGRASCRERV